MGVEVGNRSEEASASPSYDRDTFGSPKLNMMDDDNSDWLSGSVDPEPDEPIFFGGAARKSLVARKSIADPGFAAESFEPKTYRQIGAPELQVEIPKKATNKHWARPRFLQYDYLYNYMHNYYDDVIDYLDRRMRGYEVEPPKPQTWAERALRTYTRNTYPHSITYKLPRPKRPDTALLNTPHWANTWHSEHSKDYYNRKYKAILF